MGCAPWWAASSHSLPTFLFFSWTGGLSWTSAPHGLQPRRGHPKPTMRHVPTPTVGKLDDQGTERSEPKIDLERGQ
eukprot:4784895-Alexandrium_andersonii.AAC.1